MGSSLISYPTIIFRQATAPTASAGALWLDTDDNALYYYNGASWISLSTSEITEAAEASNTPVTDNSEMGGDVQKRFQYFTLPTTSKFYKITGIEWKNGTAVSDNIICGVSIVNANPPTLNSTTLVAWGDAVAQAGIGAVQRNSNISSSLIKKGTICGVWVQRSTAGSGTLRSKSDGINQNNYKGSTYAVDQPISESVAFAADAGNNAYLKVYYVGWA